MTNPLTPEIIVCLNGEQAGLLSLKSGRLQFRYVPDWLESANSMALSHSLPLREQPYEDHQCRPFFAGLLPEGHLRELLARQFNVSKSNDFGLLDAIGGECAGAISFHAPGALGIKVEQSGTEWLQQEQIKELLEQLPNRPMLAGMDGIRLSLAGAQDKVPVVFDGTRIGLPKGGALSTHILKPSIRAVKGSVINEAFCLALSSEMGLQTARAHVVEVAQFGPVLLVGRYDRELDNNGLLVRLHQEDFCQALAVPPELKYQSEGGPGLSASFQLVRQVTKPSAPQVLKLLDAVIFNFLIGNHDAHGKNFSLLYRRPTPDLAPLYDLLSTAIYPGLTAKMAMKLGGQYKFMDVLARHWEKFALDAGLGVAQVRKRVIQTAEHLPLAALKLQSTSVFQDDPTVEAIVGLIKHRAALTLGRLKP